MICAHRIYVPGTDLLRSVSVQRNACHVHVNVSTASRQQYYGVRGTSDANVDGTKHRHRIAQANLSNLE